MRGRLVPILVLWIASLASQRATGQAANTVRGAGAPPRAPATNSRAQAVLPPALPPSSTSPRNEGAHPIPGMSAVSSPAPLTLAQLESLALNNNPTIKAAEALVLQQQGLLRQLTRYPNPTVGWVQSTPSQRMQGATQGAFISQDIVTAGKLKVVGAAERVDVQWRQWQLQAQVGRVLNDVRMRYYEVLGAQDAAQAAVELERLAADDLRDLRKLLEAQQASRPDVLQAEIHLAAVRASLQDARLRHRAAWQQLVNLVGVPRMPPALLQTSAEPDIPQFDWDSSLDRLLSESPVLRAQASQVREAELELELQKRLVVPNINVQTVIQRDYVKDFDQVSTLVSAPIPLWNRNRGNILNAEGTLRLQKQEYERLRLALADQLASSFHQYLSARNQIDYLKEILPRTEENVRLTVQAFKAGQAGFDYMRVRDAEDTYLRTKTSYINALTSLRKVAIEINGLELTGGLNPTEIGTALQATPGAPAGLGGVLLQFSQQEASRTSRTLPGAIQSTVIEP